MKPRIFIKPTPGDTMELEADSEGFVEVIGHGCTTKEDADRYLFLLGSYGYEAKSDAA